MTRRLIEQARDRFFSTNVTLFIFGAFGERIVSDLKSRLHTFVYSRCFKL